MTSYSVAVFLLHFGAAMESLAALVAVSHCVNVTLVVISHWIDDFFFGCYFL